MKDNNITLLGLEIPLVSFVRIVALVFLIILLFVPALLKLIDIWYNNPDYSHGFLVIPIFLYMIWRKRELLLSLEIRPSWIGFPILSLGLIGYFIGFLTMFNTLANLSIVVTIIGLLLFLAGWRMLKEMSLPVLFLLFMFPIPSAYYIMITNPLKLMITDISAQLMGLFNIPVLQDGNLLFFANTQLEVAEACSGIRSLYSYLMLGCMFALICKKRITKIIMILTTFPLAILVNIIRVTATGVLANYYSPKVAQGFFHEFTGFILFGVGLMVLFSVYYIIEGRASDGKESN